MSSFSSPDDDVTLGDVPVGMFDSPGSAMISQVSPSSSSRKPRYPVLLDNSSSDDDDDFDLCASASNFVSSSSGSSARLKSTSTNIIYGYRYACPNIVTAHMGKNGPFSSDKVYDKEFVTHLATSISERNRKGPAGFEDMSLLCNQLDIYSVKMMRNGKENKAKQFHFSGKKGSGYTYFRLFVRVFTKKQVRDGMNSEEEMVSWLERIRVAYCATKAQFPLTLGNGGELGKSAAKYRPVDTLLLDADVAEYAKMIHNKKIQAGTFLESKERIAMFFSAWNMAVAKDLLG